ncbi:MAG: trans-2-enoyl-CoA reductase family protein [Anaerostipes sp.]|nr:trans-2-enoyl-CoA reductase family protein [Anaerostipes sp.]
MIIKPKVKEFLCLTAHPEGCKKNIENQVRYVKENMADYNGPKKVLVIGSSTGYGLASRIVAGFGCKADTIGVMFEKPSNGKRTASAGWYNTAAFEEFAKKDGQYAKTFNGDAFSKSVKEEVIATIKKDFGKVDMVIYSLAAPRRTVEDGTTYQSVLKTTGKSFTNKNLDLKNNTLGERTLEPANDDEVQSTIKVMGGEDWMDWMKALVDADAIEDGATTLAYSYIGPELTYPIYFDGTIGQAKKHLHATAKEITKAFEDKGIKGFVSVNKALVTQSSSAIPIVPLYMAILYKVMKEQGNHEGCIEQITRLFTDRDILSNTVVDQDGLIRLDDLELSKEVQDEVNKRWELVNSDNLAEIADVPGYWEDFYHMFGFQLDGVNYEQDLDPAVKIPSVEA